MDENDGWGIDVNFVDFLYGCKLQKYEQRRPADAV
jgi:hypothetical protein